MQQVNGQNQLLEALTEDEHLGPLLKIQLPSKDNGFDIEVPFKIGSDHSEGLTLLPCLGYDDGVMVVYDAPDPSRRPDPKAIFADVFLLTKHIGLDNQA